jgi:NitT/TauT family transport system ATP-binding protein
MAVECAGGFTHIQVNLKNESDRTTGNPKRADSVLACRGTRPHPTTANAMTQSIDVRRIRVEFQTPSGPVIAVRDISFHVAASEFLCVLGPSGCGKTTLMNCLAGFIAPTSGEILVDNRPVTVRGVNRGVVFQDLTQLFPWRTARENVEFGLQVRKMRKAERRERSMELLRMMGLENFGNTYPHQLSGGMQQRVAIARALAYDPGILLMDEPFAALDAMTRDNLQLQLTEIWAKTRKTIVYITHNVSEAVYLGDGIIIMDRQGSVKAALRNDLPRPRDPLSDTFVRTQREVTSNLAH